MISNELGFARNSGESENVTTNIPRDWLFLKKKERENGSPDKTIEPRYKLLVC
jgi:hypothetical protein